MNAPSPAPSPDSFAEQLETTLRGLVSAHEELLSLAAAQRSAISRADPRALADITAAQAAVVHRVVELERQRQVLVAAIVKSTPVRDARPTITALARSLADPVRSRLIGLADRLRDVLNRLQAEHAAVRAAAESLSAHMEGLMRQICRKLSHAGIYARSGVIESSAPIVTALDVRS